MTFAAYGSGDGGDAVTPESLAEDKGCELIPAETEELYVQEAYDCGDGRILTFDTGEAADNFREIAEEFGGTYEAASETILYEVL